MLGWLPICIALFLFMRPVKAVALSVDVNRGDGSGLPGVRVDVLDEDDQPTPRTEVKETTVGRALLWVSLCAALGSALVVTLALSALGVPFDIALVLGCIAAATAPAGDTCN